MDVLTGGTSSRQGLSSVVAATLYHRFVRAITLRPWQRDALDAFASRGCADFLAVACPGAGKTTFALAAIRQDLRTERRPVVVVVPTQHLKQQWANAAARFGLHLEPDWQWRMGLPADMHGIVVTYSQASTSAKSLDRVVRGGIAVLDEIHHAASERRWGDGVRDAVGNAACRLLLSGTPFRTDDHPIPFVSYSFGDHGDAVPDYSYGYGDALADGGVVRPVFFPRFDGHMEWRSHDGEELASTFDEELRRDQWSARLRTALSAEGEWLPAILAKANDRLVDIRRTHPRAGGLVIAIDQAHARAIARILKRDHRITARVALSDDPKASGVITKYAQGDDPWIVAVRMISEGVDIPRLRVAVFATNTATALFFRQAVGRIARWTPDLRSQKSYFFIPDDPRLRSHALGIAHERRHSIEVRSRALADAALDAVPGRGRAEEQLSLFEARSSAVVGDAGAGTGGSLPADGIDPLEDVPPGIEAFTGVDIVLPPPPVLPGRQPDPLDALADLRTRESQKRELREFNSARVSELARITGWDHARINGELNRRAGIRSIAEATVAQLERRLREADQWIAAG
jgi:superfamily II DNA or RNA helicase